MKIVSKTDGDFILMQMGSGAIGHRSPKYQEFPQDRGWEF